ncbi:myrosinase 1-like [Epargyreus clarus]|uniref:myrosinase 1-like n=1 Tax=Epargyreus clarus TaxID=520877 RepID=UPI003C2FFF98
MAHTRGGRESLRRFPEDFRFGVSTAAYQIEGAWNEGGKTWSMWDYLVRTDPGHIADRSNGDIAGNSYNLYERDIQMIKELGVDIYRFSISWPRLLPTGRPNYINPEGLAYYNKLIDLLIENGITPFVTMYHWDLPQNLNEQGGWLNPEIMNWFGDYARVLYQQFGDRVKHWLTINEPYVHCSRGYGRGNHAPRVRSPGIGYYECGRNILLAHARAYHIYRESFRATQNGQVAVVLSAEWGLPSTDSVDDAEAVLDSIAFHFDQYAHPVLSESGNYPQRLIDRVAAASANQGLSSSRLRPFSPEEVNYIRGTTDFLALNHYSTDIVYRNNSLIGQFEVPSYSDDKFVGTYKDPSWPTSSSPWIREYGPGFHQLLVYIKNTYNNPTIYITENGVSSTTGLNDDPRVSYYRNYLTAVLDAIDDGVNIRGYCAWSLMDNFEWAFGYTMRFGLYEIDMEDPARPRTPRKSAFVYQHIVSNRVIDYTYNPDPYTQSITGNAFGMSASILFTLTIAMFNLNL